MMVQVSVTTRRSSGPFPLDSLQSQDAAAYIPAFKHKLRFTKGSLGYHFISNILWHTDVASHMHHWTELENSKLLSEWIAILYFRLSSSSAAYCTVQRRYRGFESSCRPDLGILRHSKGRPILVQFGPPDQNDQNDECNPNLGFLLNAGCKRSERGT